MFNKLPEAMVDGVEMHHATLVLWILGTWPEVEVEALGSPSPQTHT